jgi:hypothetical protein
MKVEFESESQVVIKLPNGKGITVLYYKGSDEVSISFHKGKRHIKEHQNRGDGYSGTTFTKAGD